MAYMRLGDFLVSSSVITEQQLEKALTMQKEAKERLGDPTICMELTKKDEGCTLKHGVPRGAHAQGRGAEPWSGSLAHASSQMTEALRAVRIRCLKAYSRSMRRCRRSTLPCAARSSSSKSN